MCKGVSGNSLFGGQQWKEDFSLLLAVIVTTVTSFNFNFIFLI